MQESHKFDCARQRLAVQTRNNKFFETWLFTANKNKTQKFYFTLETAKSALKTHSPIHRKSMFFRITVDDSSEITSGKSENLFYVCIRNHLGSETKLAT